MSASALSAELLPRQPRACPHTPPCPDQGRTAKPIDRRSEYGYSVLCNGGVLFDDGTYLPPRPRSEMPLLPVVLRVWGFSHPEAALAAAEAYDSQCAGLWRIVDLVVSIGAPCKIKRADAHVAHHAVAGRVWAAYPALGAQP